MWDYYEAEPHTGQDRRSVVGERDRQESNLQPSWAYAPAIYAHVE